MQFFKNSSFYCYFLRKKWIKHRDNTLNLPVYRFDTTIQRYIATAYDFIYLKKNSIHNARKMPRYEEILLKNLDNSEKWVTFAFITDDLVDFILQCWSQT